MNHLLGINRIFPLMWRWRVKKSLGMLPPPVHPQLAPIDFFKGSRVVLDVGANLGNFAVNLLFQSPLAEVHCFEPNPETFLALHKNVARLGRHKGKPRVVATQCGVGAAPGSGELIVTRFHQASSFLPVSEACRDGWRGVDFSERGRVEVPLISLDDYAREKQISAVKLLKIDVQGYELEVLKGAGSLLANTEYVFLEVQFVPLYAGAPVWSDIAAHLQGRGFTPLSMANFCTGPSADLLQADMLFEKRGAR